MSIEHLHPSAAHTLQWLVPNPKLPFRALVVAQSIYIVARDLVEVSGAKGPELTVALRKLLEAKDAAVRSVMPAPTIPPRETNP